MTSPSHITPPASVSAFLQAVSLATKFDDLDKTRVRLLQEAASHGIQIITDQPPPELARFFALAIHAKASADLLALASSTAKDAENGLLYLILPGVDPAVRARISRGGDPRDEALVEAFARVSLTARGVNLVSGAFPLAGDDVASLQACAEAMRKALDEISETARFVHRLRLAAVSASSIINCAE